MTDDPGLTPQQDAVRRLLADARHDGPTPPEVVERLDAALASLVSELVSERGDAPSTRAASPPAPVVDLAARRRRTAGIGLLAAAAVVVAGVAIGQGLPRTSSGDDAGSSAGSEMSTSQDRELTEDDSGADSGGEAPQSLKSAAPDAAYPTLSSTDPGLDEDLLDLRATVTLRSTGTGSARMPADCDPGVIGQGRRVAAQVDGLSGVVLFRRPDGAAQQVELYVCDSPAPVRTLTLPAP